MAAAAPLVSRPMTNSVLGVVIYTRGKHSPLHGVMAAEAALLRKRPGTSAAQEEVALQSPLVNCPLMVPLWPTAGLLD